MILVRHILFLGCALAMGGCSVIPRTAKGIVGSSQETVKTLWGSSTRALEAARKEAESRTFTCTFDECFDAVMALTQKEQKIPLEQPEQSAAPTTPVVFETRSATSYISHRATPSVPQEKRTTVDLFLQDRKKGHLVVMGVLGSVDTTEVGIFFSEVVGERQVTIEISSLSPYAKLAVAELVFDDLGQKFSKVAVKQ
jgi:hypothetical protein